MDNLTYRREDLVRILQERLAERQQARADAETERASEQVTISERVSAAMVEHPQFLVWVSAQCRNIGLDVSSDEFMEEIEDLFGGDTLEDYDPDESLVKQIRVLETAADETIQVRVTDNIYAYL